MAKFLSFYFKRLVFLFSLMSVYYKVVSDVYQLDPGSFGPIGRLITLEGRGIVLKKKLEKRKE